MSNYRVLVDVRPTAVAPLLALARAYAGLKDKKKAVEYLTKAIDAGLKDAQALNRSAEFQNLRGDERFEQQMKRLASATDN